MHLARLCLLLLPCCFALTSPVAAKFKEAAMRLPDELAQVERLPVTGRQGWKLVERLQFGDFSVHDVRRSLTKGGDLQVLFYEGSKRRQTFGFTLTGSGPTVWRGAAATNLRRRALDLGVEVEMRNKSGFSAHLFPADAPEAVWTLALHEKGEKPLAGTLSRGAETITVQGTNRLAGSVFRLADTAGYTFAIGGRSIAAVEVINHGAVWLAPDLDAAWRGPVTAAIAALLLFEELRATLPE